LLLQQQTTREGSINKIVLQKRHSANFFLVRRCSDLWLFVENIREAALAAVLPIGMGCHEHTSPALCSWALSPHSGDFIVIIHLVVLQDGELDFLLFVFDLLGLSVNGLPAFFLATTTKAKHEMEGGFFLYVVVR